MTDRDAQANKAVRWQSLVEMVLVTPLLLMLVVIAGYLGIGMYHAQMASDAIRQPAMRKWEMANNPKQITEKMVLGYTTNKANPNLTQGNIQGGDLDDIDFVNVNDDISVVVGTKRFSAMGLPTFNFTVAQAVNRKLLRNAANNKAVVRKFTDEWLPYGSPRTIPWEEMKNDRHKPLVFEMLDNGCRTEDVDKTNQNVLSRYILPSETYIARTYTDEPSPVTQSTLMQIADTLAESCKAKDEAKWTSECQQEYEDLMPSDDQSVSGAPPGTMIGTYNYNNPHGGPAMKMTYKITCSSAGPPCKTDDEPEFAHLPTIDENHGLYWDPTGKYRKPPADFVNSCKASKQAMCQLRDAAKIAQDITGRYREECKGF